MLFRAQNLGPIRDAELDLSKSLIILAGPNNSGKTYLGWALYGLSHFNKPLPCVRHMIDGAVKSLTGIYDAGPTGDFIALFTEELCASYAQNIHRDFSATARTFASLQLTLIPDLIKLSRYGGIYRTREHLIRFEIYDSEGILSLRLIATKNHRESERVSHQNDTSDDTNDGKVLLASLATGSLEKFAERTSQSLTRRLSWGLFHSAFTIFPVERIATTIFARELLIRRVEMLEEDAIETEAPASVPPAAGRYPLPIRHSLLAAADLDALSVEVSIFHDLAEELEGSVLQGSFKVDEHGEVLFIPRTSPEQTLGLHQSASVVKSLSALVFYFRHLADEGDSIIIDEPELNLHPDNQRRVARVLAKASNRGIKVMMSTHSDYLIGEFNNLLMLGRDTPQAAEVRQELGYDVASVLKPEQVGVYLVSDGLCKPVEVKQTGFEIKTFEDAFHSMNRDAQTIYNRVFAESE